MVLSWEIAVGWALSAGWGYEAEVALVGSLHTIDTCVIGIHVLCDLEGLVVASQAELCSSVIAEGLNVHVLHVLVEESEAYHTYALEVVVDREVDVPRCCRLDVRVADSSFLVSGSS